MRISPPHRPWYRFVLCVLLASLPAIGWAQGSQEEPEEFGPVWDYVVPRLGDPASPGSFTFIDDRIRAVCHDARPCRYAVYDSLVVRLEEVFHLPAAVYAAEQRLRLARFSGMDDRLIKNYRDLYRFHQALGNYEVSLVNLENAIAAARRSGNEEMLENLTFAKLEDGLEYLDPDLAFAALDSLMRAMEKRGDTRQIMMAHVRLSLARIHHNRPAEAAIHIAALEAYPYSDTLTKDEVTYLMIAAAGRGDLAKMAGQSDSAVVHYQHALNLARRFSRSWWEVTLLNKLAEQEGILGRGDRAWEHLDAAAAKATTFGLVDLLAENYGIAASLAEREVDYAKALRFQKLKQAQLAESNQRSAGFSTRNYYLTQEKEALEAARELQQRQLRLQQTYSRTLLGCVIVISALAIGLVLAYRNQLRRQQELAHRNVVISEQADRLEELDQVKSTFFANVSHELRTPLTLIIGPLSTLRQDRSLNERQRRLLDMISSSGHRLETLVMDLLRLSKLEHNQARLELEQTELLPFFQEPFAQFAALAQARQLHFTSDVRVPVGTRGEIDREKCRRIVFNLLSNAFTHTQAGGRIHALVTAAEGQLQLFVEDNGTGIHPDDLPHIFDRYWQSSRPDKTEGGGVGIGLSLCQKYAWLLGGEIRVKSRLGEGATFHLTFPLTIEEAVAVLPDPAPPGTTDATGPPSTRPTILVAEDNPDVAAFLRLILGETYTVVLKENGRDALAYLRDVPGSVDLLITDLMMPIMDGFALLEAIKGDPALGDLPAVVLTARSGDADKLRVLRLGVDDYLIKPFSQEELLVRLRNLLRNRSVRIAQPVPVSEATPNERDDRWLREFENYVRKHCGDPDLTMLHLAREFAMSESTLLRKLKALIGLTPQKYVQEVRLEGARHRLETQAFDTLEQLARDVGYRSARSLSRSFVQRFGRPPSSYLPD